MDALWVIERIKEDNERKALRIVLALRLGSKNAHSLWFLNKPPSSIGWGKELIFNRFFSNTQSGPKKEAVAAAAKSLQSCPTLCYPTDGSPPGSPIPGILQARTLEWVAISFSNAWKWKVKVKSLSRVWLFVTPWTAAYQAPPSMGFSGQQYWSGVPLSSPI